MVDAEREHVPSGVCTDLPEVSRRDRVLQKLGLVVGSQMTRQVLREAEVLLSQFLGWEVVCTGDFMRGSIGMSFVDPSVPEHVVEELRTILQDLTAPFAEDRNRAMKNHIKDLRARIHGARAALQQLEAELRSIERSCPHDWKSLPERVEVQPGYYIPAEHHGSDFYPSCQVPENRTVFYRRECVLCGKLEETSRVATKTVSTPVPVWG